MPCQLPITELPDDQRPLQIMNRYHRPLRNHINDRRAWREYTYRLKAGLEAFISRDEVFRSQL